ncbi:FAD-binding domain-containing protein [Zopfia rhizophila CBS 207.26]|uniref:FAD-binding domain-containing protein n=1 Tax=Zopfia rhizophila CBS 207.26 TaxID=1314779 RepID=A0A6A6DQ07_9PEZI|nr:FAD-binding domain-containing protein [Zopfia rhizophila CBS 207.26]
MYFWPFFRIIAFFTFSYRIPPIHAFASNYTQKCRCFPGEPCWPKESEWAAFNQSINGRLIATNPIGHVCHGDTYDAQQCAHLRASWNDPKTHYTTSSSIMAPYFANQSCDPFTSISARCGIGTYIQYAVNATGASDYQKAIRFAQRYNLRLVIRNTGHDYLGKSTGAGALGIWTHNMKSIEVLQYNSSSYTGKAIKLGAGVQSLEAFKEAHQHGLLTVGGNCPTVGIAGGYTQGGGIGPLTSMHGLGVEQALEWEVVTASGELLKVSQIEHEDLFWALNGGGGGTYGAILSLTVKAYEDVPMAGANLTFTREGVSQDAFFKVVEKFHECLPALADAGAVAIWTLTNTSFVLAPVTASRMSKEEVDGFLKPTFDELRENGMNYTYFSKLFPSYFDNYNALNPPPETSYFQMGGRFMPRSVVASRNAEMTHAMREIVGYGAGIGGLSFKALTLNQSRSSLNPLWQDALVSVAVGIVWDNTNWDLNLANQGLMTHTLIPTLDKLTPNASSVYLNEADFREPDWQQVFYGSSYEGLLRIKRKYDPNGLFYGRTAVGSEVWTEQTDGRLCHV